MASLFHGLVEGCTPVKAEPLFLRALAISEQILGSEHPDTVTSLHNLAGLYYAQGTYVKAEPLFLRAVQIATTSLGYEHPHTQQLLRNYVTNLAARYTGGDVEAMLQLIATQHHNEDASPDT